MATFKQRLPAKSDALTVFIICILVSNLWAIFRFLHEIPRFLLAFDSLWKTTGLFAYHCLQALLDGVLLWAFIVAVAAILPARWLRDNFATQGSWVALGLFVWIALKLQWVVRIFGLNYILATSVVLVALIATTNIFSNPHAKWHKIPYAIIDRLTVLGYLYLFLDVVSLGIVLVRNLTFSLS